MRVSRRRGDFFVIDYRKLKRDEVKLLGAIDRSERIDGVYRLVEGRLELQESRLDVAGWEPVQLKDYVRRLEELHDAAGVIVGAWDGPNLVGLGSLETKPVGGDARILKLDMLYVSASCRHQGVGRALTQLLSDEARTLGAMALYVSATPSRNTVEAYFRMGARRLETPDPLLFEREPEDIHLLLQIG